ncbi:MAG: exonuclease domain-containing protein [Candidatus Sedimenticola sp. PURPLELP]
MSIWKYLFNLEERRNWYLRKMPQCPLRDYYETPFPALDADWKQVDYLALDFETTGLDQKRDDILSVGYTTIRGQSLFLDDATHILTKPTRTIPEESAVVHGILDDEASSAQKLEQVLPVLLNALAGKAMLAHHAAIEYNFLNNACRRIYGYPFIGPVVDTLALEVRQFRSRDKSIKQGDLRLANARDRYGLPRYPAHNALTDAIAAGELFLAQAVYRQGKRSPTLKEITVIS